MKKLNSYLLVACALSFYLFSCNKSSSDPSQGTSTQLFVSAISPTSGTSDIIDTITGRGFSTTASGDRVLFNGTAATVINATDSQLIVKVPPAAGVGKVSVSVGQQSASGPVFTFTGDSMYVVSTLVGNAGVSSITGFFPPITSDSSGNLYLGQYTKIVKVSATGTTSNFVGGDSAGSQDGTGASAGFHLITGLAIDHSGLLYVADRGSNEIRKVSPAGVVTTFAGSATRGYVDATGTAAEFHFPYAITIDPTANVYVSDDVNYRIRRITPDAEVSTFIGSGVQGSADGTGSAASFNDIAGMSSDGAGNIYFIDDVYNTIRKVTPAGVTTRFAGGGTGYITKGTVNDANLFAYPIALTIDKYDNIYVADYDNQVIRKISIFGNVSTIAGVPSRPGSTDGPGAQAQFYDPVAITVDAHGNIYVVDSKNNNIRKLTPR